jgi:hypothetical protein
VLPGGDIESCAPAHRFDAAVLRLPPSDSQRQLTEGSYWSDGMVRVSGRDFSAMKNSPCYQRGELSCLSCHSMHSYNSTDDQLAPRRENNSACIQCHTTYAAKLEQHTHHRADSSGSLCYNCHMPHTTYGLVKAIRSHQIDSPSVQSSLNTGRPNACNLCHLDRSLGWSAQYLQQWYSRPQPNLTSEQQETSAAVNWLLSGDAGQRALVAWHLGWEPAQQASGRDWLAPYLAELLTDPYSVVRLIAHRSLRQLPGFENFSYDYSGPEAGRTRASASVLQSWSTARKPDAQARPAVLLNSSGTMDREKFSSLLLRRNQRPLELLE